MAWYRAGGGGIPSAIKTDMNAVLNKKFGTSQDYPPTDWATSVNLLGLLPEKTASGAIANFEDGADEVPIKSWDVTVDANLDGVSSIKVTQAVKNLLPFVNYDGGAYNPAVGTTLNLVKSATQFTKNGNAYSIDTTTSWTTFTVLAELKNGVGYHIKYTFSASGANLGRSNIFLDADFKVLATYNETANPNTTNENLTIPTGAKYYCIVFTNRSTSVNTLTITEPQLEVGNSASAYADYTTPTITTVSLGRTIYGGSADVVTGEGQETHKGYTLDNLMWSGSLFDGNWVWYTDLSADGLKLPFASNIFSGICDTYTPISFTGVLSNTNTIALHNNGYLYVNNGSSETEPTGKVTIELATPTDFTFDPITPTPETALGVNNFWADEGDSEVTYRADISLLLNSLQNNRGLMMMRPVNTEEIEFEEGE